MVTGETRTSPSVNHIVQVIEADIRAGRYPNGRWLPSERELAEQFGVSRVTIRQAVEALEARKLIVRAPRCRPLVQNMAQTPVVAHAAQRNLVFWNWPGPRDPGGAAITRGIQKALDPDHHRLIVSGPRHENFHAVVRSEAQFLERLSSDREIAGAILYYLGDATNLPALQKLRAADKPMVFIDRLPPAGFEADYVGVDNERAAERVVEHLITRGHRRIAFLTNYDTASTVAERLAGYQRALKQAGIPFDAALVQRHTESAPGDYRATNELIAYFRTLPDPPTAVFAVNDRTALTLLAALRAQGLRVPEDLAVAGFDGLERWWPGTPFLTTAMQPFERIGERATELLLKRIESGSTTAFQHLVLEAPLSIHGSTGPAGSGPAHTI